MSYFRGGGFKTKTANPYSKKSIKRLIRNYPAKRNTYGMTKKAIKNRALERKMEVHSVHAHEKKEEMFGDKKGDY